MVPKLLKRLRKNVGATEDDRKSEKPPPHVDALLAAGSAPVAGHFSTVSGNVARNLSRLRPHDVDLLNKMLSTAANKGIKFAPGDDPASAVMITPDNKKVPLIFMHPHEAMSPAVLGHEMGHLRNIHSRWEAPLRYLTHYSHKSHLPAALASTGIGALLSKTPKGAEHAGLAGALIGGGLALPRLLEEAVASGHGLRAMRQHGATWGQVGRGALGAAPAFGSYALAAAPSVLAPYLLGRALSAYRKRRDANRLMVKKADFQYKTAGLQSSPFHAGFVDELLKTAGGIGARGEESVSTLSSKRPKKWFGRESSARSEGAQDLSEDRADSPSKARIQLAGLRGGTKARLVQRLKEKRREERKPGSREWQGEQNLSKRQAASISGAPDKHSPAAVESAGKQVRKAPLFSKAPEWESIPTESRKVKNPIKWSERFSPSEEAQASGAARAGESTGKAVRSAGKGAWSAVKAPVLFGSGLLSGLAASKKSPFAERAGKVAGKVIGGTGRFLYDKAKRVARATARVSTAGSAAFRAYDGTKGVVRGLFKKGEKIVPSSFYIGFVDELLKIAAKFRHKMDPTAPFGFRAQEIDDRPWHKKALQTAKNAANITAGTLATHGVNPVPVTQAATGGVDDPQTATGVLQSVKGIPGAARGLVGHVKNWFAARRQRAEDARRFKALPG